MTTPRIRMFAGPNGSGKSTLKEVISKELIGIYVNADEIEQEIQQTGRLSLARFELRDQAGEIQKALLTNKRLEKIQVEHNPAEETLFFENGGSYLASVVSEEIRKRLMDLRKSFTFETVMSHESKPALLETAQDLGYRTYLYFVATEDPDINVSRVAYRVSQNGHDVPADKIISRYERSLNLLLSAIRASDRAFLFDNSGQLSERNWFAEVTDGKSLEFKSNSVPAWFQKYVIQKVQKTLGS